MNTIDTTRNEEQADGIANIVICFIGELRE